MWIIKKPEALQRLGTELTPNDQRHVLGMFTNRYTGDHTPQWVKDAERKEGKRYPLQFATDAEWLANTRFGVREDGRLDPRVGDCQSTPTWPNGKDIT